MARIFALIIIATAAIAVGSPLLAQTDTAFTYQGELKENGGIANGAFNMEFSLWDTASVGNQIGTPDIQNGVQVVEGKFTVELNFGANAFDNSGRWLEISVNGLTLSPRNPITRSPYSIQTRGIFVSDNGNVGLGTIDPSTALHIAKGASILSIPSAYTEEVWVLGENLPLPNTIGIIIASLTFVGMFGYFMFYKDHFRGYQWELAKRVVLVYLITFVVSAMILWLLQKLPLMSDPLTALNRTVLVAFPGCFSGTVVDSLK